MDAHNWHTVSPSEVLERLESRLAGLTEEEAAQRLLEYGPNELEKEEKASPLALFLEQFKNILIIILIHSPSSSASFS